MTIRSRPCSVRFSRRARAASLEIEQAAGVVDEERRVSPISMAESRIRLELRRRCSPRGGSCSRRRRSLGQQTHGQLLGATFRSEKKATMPAVDGLLRAVGLRLRRRWRLATSKAMLVASAVLPMDGTAGEDHQVGGVQAADLGVEVAQAGGDAGQAAVALVGARPPCRRRPSWRGERHEAASERPDSASS